jgi:hypothetical protein
MLGGNNSPRLPESLAVAGCALVLSGPSIPASAPWTARGSWGPGYSYLEMLFRSQRKLHHAFQELVRRQADEVVHDELLGV